MRGGRRRRSCRCRCRAGPSPHRRGFEVRVEVALPGGLAGLRVEGDQFVEEGDVDAPFVMDGRGDVGRLAGVARIAHPPPEDLVVAEPDRLQVAELVDDVGDPTGHRRRETRSARGCRSTTPAAAAGRGHDAPPAGSGSAPAPVRTAASRRTTWPRRLRRCARRHRSRRCRHPAQRGALKRRPTAARLLPNEVSGSARPDPHRQGRYGAEAADGN